jgi:phospholipase C
MSLVGSPRMPLVVLAMMVTLRCDSTPTPPKLDDAQAAAARAACQFERGAMPEDTLGPSAPLGPAIPIANIVVLMQENRSFDSYFEHLNQFAGRNDIETAPSSATNPDGDGGTKAFIHAPHLCVLDTNHEWGGTHREWDNGKMDGFFQQNDGWDGEGTMPDGGAPSLLDGQRAMWWLDENDMPFYYKLASTFAIGDHYHAALLGPTWPNRDFMYAATSFGITDARLPDLNNSPYPDVDVVIFDLLEKAGVSWNIFGDGLPGAAVTVGVAIVNRWGRDPLLPMSEFFAEAQAGKLPQVSFVDPHLGSQNASQNDEHPPADAQVGQAFVASVVEAMFASPQWSRSAMFLTYDEHGGFYDHVPPPKACPPDDIAPILASGDTTVGGFDRLGIRVPMTVVSPYAKPHYVSHVTYDHTSILRFIEAKFGLPALTARDANAEAMFDFFDFSKPSFLTPPSIPAPTVDPNELLYCQTTFHN